MGEIYAADESKSVGSESHKSISKTDVGAKTGLDFVMVGGNDPLAGVAFDEIQRVYEGGSTVDFQYLLASDLQAYVSVTYEDDTLCDFVSAVWTYS